MAHDFLMWFCGFFHGICLWVLWKQGVKLYSHRESRFIPKARVHRKKRYE